MLRFIYEQLLKLACFLVNKFNIKDENILQQLEEYKKVLED